MDIPYVASCPNPLRIRGFFGNIFKRRFVVILTGYGVFYGIVGNSRNIIMPPANTGLATSRRTYHYQAGYARNTHYWGVCAAPFFSGLVGL